MFNPKIRANNLDSLDLEKYIEIVEDLSKINRESIEDELTQFAAYFSYYYGLQVKAKRNLDNSIFALDNYRSGVKTDIRKTTTRLDSGSKLTVEALNDMVNSKEDVKSLNSEVSRAEEIYGLMKGICLTLEHKKDMLVQLSANKRQEIKLH
jgi:chromosome segregation ATPase